MQPVKSGSQNQLPDFPGAEPGPGRPGSSSGGYVKGVLAASLQPPREWLARPCPWKTVPGVSSREIASHGSAITWKELIGWYLIEEKAVHNFISQGTEFPPAVYSGNFGGDGLTAMDP